MQSKEIYDIPFKNDFARETKLKMKKPFMKNQA